MIILFEQENDDGLGLFIGLESIEEFDGIILSIESEELPSETDLNQVNFFLTYIDC